MVVYGSTNIDQGVLGLAPVHQPQSLNPTPQTPIPKPSAPNPKPQTLLAISSLSALSQVTLCSLSAHSQPQTLNQAYVSYRDTFVRFVSKTIPLLEAGMHLVINREVQLQIKHPEPLNPKPPTLTS